MSFFIKIVVFLTIVNDDPSLTIVNDEPSLTIVNYNTLITIVNEERKSIWRASVLIIGLFLRKYQEVLAPPQLFSFM